MYWDRRGQKIPELSVYAHARVCVCVCARVCVCVCVCVSVCLSICLYNCLSVLEQPYAVTIELITCILHQYNSQKTSWKCIQTAPHPHPTPLIEHHYYHLGHLVLCTRSIPTHFQPPPSPPNYAHVPFPSRFCCPPVMSIQTRCQQSFRLGKIIKTSKSVYSHGQQSVRFT